MQRTHTKEVFQKVGQHVTIAGFVQTIRDQGKIKFLLIRDTTGLIQVVLADTNETSSALAESLTLESVVQIMGTAKAEPQAPGGVEIQAEELQVLSHAAPALPIPVIEKGQGETDQQKRLDWRWLDLRKPNHALIFRVWTSMEQAFRSYCIANDYIEIHSPKLTATATESGAELFEVQYFDRKAHLAQSPQLYKQMAMASGFEKVFEVGPVFRANPSFTSRHDTEFTMYDVELSYISSHHDLMAEEEKMIVAILSDIEARYGKAILDAFGREVTVPSTPFPKLTLREAKDMLRKMGVPNERGDDMSPEEERAICAHVKEQTGSEFVFIHEFPTHVRAFYSMRKEGAPELSNSFDLLWNGLEITSGAQREHRVTELEKQITEQGLDLEDFETYLNFFRYGCPPHGGFAPGPTRMLMKLLDIQNVRDVTYLYRGVKRLTP